MTQIKAQFIKLTQTGWRGNLASFFLGLWVFLGFAPFKWWPLPIACLLACLYLCRELSPKQAFIRIYCFSVAWFLTGTGWVYVSIHEFGHASPPLASLLTVLLAMESAFWPAAALALGHYFFKPYPRLYCFFVLPLALVLSEYCRTIIFTGFPWLLFGYTHTDTWLAEYAPWVGVYGISWLVGLLIGCALHAVHERKIQVPHIATALVVTLLPFLLKVFDPITSTGQSKSVSLVQANIPQDRKWLPEELMPTVRYYEAATFKEFGQDLIIWPEAALPVSQHRIQDFLNRLSSQAEQENSAIVLGIPAYEPEQKLTFNRVLALGKDRTQYDKRHLVPFGEYVPLEQWLRGVIAFFDLPMSQFTEGSADQRAMRIDDIWLAPTICYEIVYPEIVRENVVNQGEIADVLLTISNDAWFGESIGPIQHFQMARMRAIELGRPLIRGTNTGVTGIVDHRGVVTHLLTPYKRGVLQGEVKLVNGKTFYLRGGHHIVDWLLVLGVLALSGFYFWLRQQDKLRSN